MTNRMVRRGNSSGATDMLSLRDMMGRLMENAFISPDQWLDDFGMHLPAMDVSEMDDAYVVKAELPGWKPENIEVTCEGDTVTLKGQLENEDQREDGSTRWHHREMRRTSFERSITLPSEVEADKANANFDNGILTLRIPKSEAAKPKQIKIGMGEQSMQGANANRVAATRGNASRQ